MGYALLVVCARTCRRWTPSPTTGRRFRWVIGYTADNVLIGEFGEERRNFVPIDDDSRTS